MRRFTLLALAWWVAVVLAACQAGGSPATEPPAPPRPTALAPASPTVRPAATPTRAAGQPQVSTAQPNRPAEVTMLPQPQPGPEGWTEISTEPPDWSQVQKVPFYVEDARLVRMDKERLVLQVRGQRPRPCDGVRAQVRVAPDAARIEVEVFGIANPRMLCVEMLAPTQGVVDLTPWLQGLPPGQYTVFLNTAPVDTLTWPPDE